MIWDETLEPGESICWEGRPAPRCYTFRHWRHSIFGLLILAICGYWQVLGVEMSAEYQLPWLVWVPTPFLLFAFYLAAGHLIQARLEWNHVYYAMTERRLLSRRGILKQNVETLALSEVTYFSLHHQGEQLGTLRVYQGQHLKLILHCLEFPRQATALLEKSMGKAAPSGDSGSAQQEEGATGCANGS